MKYLFSINYKTSWGEELKMKAGKRLFDMEYEDGGRWSVRLTGRDLKPGQKYSYELIKDGSVIRKEWRGHVLPEITATELVVCDRWQSRPANSPFWSSAFTEVIFRRPGAVSFRNPAKDRKALSGRVVLEVTAPEVRSDESVAVFGSFNGWAEPVIMDDGRFPFWVGAVDSQAFEYKYAIVDSKTGEVRLWEKGGNRFFASESPSTLWRCDSPEFPTMPWRGAGLAVPVFSLRSEESFGVGEFHDIPKLVDWAVATGMNVVQILPINDTSMTGTWQDSYPYNAVSSFALHPQFIHLPSAGVRRDKAYKALQEELNALPEIDYERVNKEKKRLLKKAFTSRWERLSETDECKAFIDANKDWLLPFAVFSALKDEKGTPDFSTWGKESKFSPRLVKSYHEAHRDEVDFYIFEQYLLDVQLKEAVKYAHEKGVVLKGDLPIGVSRTSADAWSAPELYNLDSQAGAPPDAFSKDGQNWGFPTYNWDKMAETGFAWWKQRLGKMNEYFDAYRIDHILGFFRIWEIPARYRSGLMGHFSPALPFSREELRDRGFDMSSDYYSTSPDSDETNVLFIEDPRKKGYFHPRISAQDTLMYKGLPDHLKRSFDALHEDFFYRRHNLFWKESAYRKLPEILRSSGMLSCGEDLGMIPACVPETMEDLSILSLEIQRMPKDVHVEFARCEEYPYLSVCATGTHDTSPLRAWWEEDRDLTRRFFNNVLGCSGDAPYFCEPWVAEMIVRQHLKSPSMLSILPLQDWLAVDGDVRYQGNPADERINIPANPRHYWRYRMHCTLESLISNEALNSRLRSLVESSGRGK